MLLLLVDTNFWHRLTDLHLSKLIMTVLTLRDVSKGPVKLIKRVKIAYSFLQSVSDQFHVMTLSLPM